MDPDFALLADSDLVDLGYGICTFVGAGGTRDAAAHRSMDAGFAYKEAYAMMYGATQNLCVQYKNAP
jgi:hypothetical protein